MSLLKKHFGLKEHDPAPLEEINAAPKVDGLQDYSDTCDIRKCFQCGCKVWVNKLAPSDLTVCCMGCAKSLVSQKNK